MLVNRLCYTGSSHRKPVHVGVQYRMCIRANSRSIDRVPPSQCVPFFVPAEKLIYRPAGFAASAPIACGGGSVSDLFSERDRAGAMALFTLGPIIGPVVGPIAGGFIAQYAGYKYIFIVIAGLAGLAAIVGIPFLRETYHPVVRLRRDKHAADPELAAKMHPHLLQGHSNKLDRMWTDLSRPFILLTRSYVCFLLSLYMAL